MVHWKRLITILVILTFSVLHANSNTILKNDSLLITLKTRSSEIQYSCFNDAIKFISENKDSIFELGIIGQTDSIPMEMLNLPCLTRLIVVTPNLLTFPEINTIDNLTYIYFKDMQIQAIPLFLFKQINLEGLYIDNLRISEIPSQIGCLKKLISLTITNCDITELPKEISELHNLQRLDISYNSISIFPDQICDLSLLSKIDISHNKIQSLPSNIGNLEYCSELFANDNKIEYLPESISNIKELSLLMLDNNLICQIPKKIFKHGKELTVSLCNNPLQRKFVKKLRRSLNYINCTPLHPQNKS
jgi:internalin A